VWHSRSSREGGGPRLGTLGPGGPLLFGGVLLVGAIAVGRVKKDDVTTVRSIRWSKVKEERSGYCSL
jgi:hypothetical protein